MFSFQVDKLRKILIQSGKKKRFHFKAEIKDGEQYREREKQHDGLENIDPRFPTPLFVSECHKRAV